MIYVIVALKSEAQAFVDKYKLPPTKENKNISITVSGMGIQNMFEATCEVVNKMKKGDSILNVGICGASKNYKIGQLLNAKDIVLTCVDSAQYTDHYDVVDMESSGFKRATLDLDKCYIFKIVSDHFDPKSVTKDKAKQLIFNKIDEIMENVL